MKIMDRSYDMHSWMEALSLSLALHDHSIFCSKAPLLYIFGWIYFLLPPAEIERRFSIAKCYTIFYTANSLKRGPKRKCAKKWDFQGWSWIKSANRKAPNGYFHGNLTVCLSNHRWWKCTVIDDVEEIKRNSDWSPAINHRDYAKRPRLMNEIELIYGIFQWSGAI